MPRPFRPTPRPTILALAVLLAAGPMLASGAAQAQAAKTREVAVASGKQIRLIAVPNLKKDCSLGPQPEVKVTTPPKNGALVQRAGKVKTPATYRCPNVEANVQAVFYESKAGFTGADEVTVEIKGTDGNVVTQTIKVTVGGAKDAPKDGAKKDTTDL
ncbi:4-aminobutyrate aminotransferase [Methylobacterium variabile]|jgi:VCBS repeat-containing protein|uniref:4-aminobutyrate aminotransferase n=1 Tax=Methylobacterium variabile TaxID=298794 RepID=A0A0J6S457_9HYPH|nr:4-aminobutyrate aminotransferase [Methylobacterium variabile]